MELKLIPIILAGIWIWFIKKSYKEERQKKQQVTTTMDEVFPNIEIEADTNTDDTVTDTAINEPQHYTMRSNTSMQNNLDTIISAPHTAEQKQDAPANTNTTHEVENRKEKITFSTKSEAKKAFIYSEIFNKKY